MNNSSIEQRRIGNYDLHRLLGSSDVAEVYQGEHILFHTTVAIKIVTLREKDDITRFLDRASRLIHLRHPHIVSVQDYGTQDGRAFLVMDYAPNGTLRQRHPKGTLVPLPAVVAYVQDIASALNYIHQQNLVHRDVKPHNMLIGAQNQVMLSDFEIAVTTSSLSPEQDYTEEFEGTVLYAAPEQLQGNPRCASDQYALGMVAYEWLSGDCPFKGTFEAITRQHFFAPPPSLRKQRPDLLPEVEHVIMKALAKETEQRFPDIAAFARALQQAAGIPQVASPEVAPRTRRQFMLPHPFSY
jgi:serine/threonine protein kinase